MHKLKPAAPAAAHLLLAALLWTAIGAFLTFRGVTALGELSTALAVALGGVGVAVGIAKGIFVLRPVAAQSAARILERGDGRCLGGFLSVRSWLVVLGMMAGGKLLRASGLPPWFTGPLLSAVGAGLLLGSGVYWAAWSGKILRRR